ncbi:unnamed protein product [Paramecium pentaurelia]|uniref:P-loop containing nucleoside triphosphate hydrolase n=1 Tax=Paramecium pentaurelia TaxID=43138 RepID=A0A8S1U4M7_9CILI|nr:unnamed protein product [Paramecium pentaurelia]
MIKLKHKQKKFIQYQHKLRSLNALRLILQHLITLEPFCIKITYYRFEYVKKLEQQFFSNEDNQTKVFEDINYQKVYQQLTNQNTDWQQIINFLKQKDFCEQNNINLTITDNLEIISKLKDKVFDLLRLNHLTQIEEFGYPYIDIFKILLSFIEKNKDLDESEQRILQMVVGSLLEKQILQFLEFENTIMESDQFEATKKIIIALQMEAKKYQDFQMELSSLSFDQKNFIKLCTIQTKEKLLEHVKKQISLLLYSKNFKWEKEIDLRKIDQHFLLYDGFESLYFSTIFYFLQCYCYQKYGELTKFQNNLKQLNKIEQTQRFIKNFISKTKEKSQDQIYLFVINHSVQFTNKQEEYLEKEKIIKYKQLLLDKERLIYQLLEKNVEGNVKTNIFYELRFIPLLRLKKIVSQLKKIGNENIDQFLGNQNIDKVIGNKNIDQLIGSENIDQVVGNENIDQFIVNQNIDKVIGNKNIDQLIGSENIDQVVGNENIDQFIVNQNIDKVIGNKNIDQLIGSENIDQVVGNENIDQFILEQQFFSNEDNQTKVFEDINYQKVYQQLTNQNTDWQQIINFLKQKDFCEQNNINLTITDNLEIISKLKDKVFDLLRLNHLTQIEEFGYPYIDIFKILLSFIEKNKDLDESEQRILQMVVGSLLEKQILQFLEFENTIMESDQFEATKKIIIALQMEAKKYQDFQMELSSLSFDQKNFIKLCTIQTKEKLLEHVKKQISLLLYSKNFKWEKEIDLRKIDQHFLLYDGFESLYFSTIFYFLQCYCYQKYGELTKFQNNLKQLNKIEQTQRFIKNFISKTKEKSQDQIYLFVINHSVQFTNKQEEYLEKEKIIKYKQLLLDKERLIYQLLEKNVEGNVKTNIFYELRFIPLLRLKKIVSQLKKIGNENIDQFLGNQNIDKVIGNKNIDQLIGSENIDQVVGNENIDQFIVNQNIDKVIGNKNIDQIIGSENIDQIIGSKNGDQIIGNENIDQVTKNDESQKPQDKNVLQEKLQSSNLIMTLKKSCNDINFFINELINQEKNLFYGEIVLLLEILKQKFQEEIQNILNLYNLNISFKQLKTLMLLMKFFNFNYPLARQQQLNQRSIFEDLLDELSLLNEKEKFSLRLLLGKKKFQILIGELINQYLISDILNRKKYMQILKKFIPMCSGKYEQKIQTFIVLFSCLIPWLLNYLLLINKKSDITEGIFKRTLIIIFTIISKKNEQFSKYMVQNLHILFDKPCYKFDLIWKVREKQVSDKLNFKLNLIQFFYCQQLYESLSKECYILFKEHPLFYEDYLGKVNYFGNIKIHSSYFLYKETFEGCPQEGNFSLEDFNISLTETSQEQEKIIVQDWLDDIKDKSKFKKLIPFFFNIIKRGESSTKLLSIITTYRRKGQESIKITSNMKALFQLFFNNSNEELQVMLLKLYSNMFPVPLIFQNPNLCNINKETDLYIFNEKLYYVFQKSFTIINLSLSKRQTQIGKTELINEIFYKQEKFETQDTCQLNNNTIDIMFDTQFNGSRNLSVADAHGQIPIDILIKILPLFQLWIIQVDSEIDLSETENKLNQITQIIPKENHNICIIIRNHQEIEEKIEEYNKMKIRFESEGIRLHKIIDLAQKGLDKSQRELQFQQAQAFIFNEIYNRNKQPPLKTEQEFLQIIKNFDTGQKQISKRFLQDRAIIKDLEEELNRLILKPLGFYDQDAFPIRSIEYQLKVLREIQNENIQQGQGNNLSQIKFQSQNNQHEKNSNQLSQQEIKQKISDLEDQIKNQKLSVLLKMFCKMFQQSSYYILYLQFTDQVRKFNELNTYKLQEENQEINDQLMKLKKERDVIKLKKSDIKQETESILINDQKNQEYKKQQDELKDRLKKNLEDIGFRNIGIEIFWRELIAINQRCMVNTIIDPADKVYEMIKKGEPFEFLDGDCLQINEKFLDQLKNKFTGSGNEKLLVISVLGPQSSGKSTILNKIFGCHFWTSVGRCTKGIYLNLLKIQFKEYFNNLFDYILILDSEGLQNPNQVDPEFDKKIALFVLAISDIILINVKGDIHQQFKNLVEMCIFTLVSMKTNLSSIKQLTWCFNQNNDANNFAPFLNQIQGIANNLNLEYNTEGDEKNKTIDYNEFLNISKDNIQILGFACIEKLWRKNESLGIVKDQRQLIINETFSEEAYLFGIRMIKNFIQKFQSQNDTFQMQSLSLFIQNISTNWQTICNLPDLLEFAELIQYKQDQIMKKKFEQIYDQEDFNFVNEIGAQINDQISNNPQKNLTYFNQIQVDKNEELRQRFIQIEKDIEEKLFAFKQDQRIQKKIYLKYIKQLSQRINSSLKNSEIVVFEEIKNIEREYQNKKGFKSLDDFILNISSDPKMLSTLKQNEEQIINAFNELWGEITNESEQKQSEILREYSIKQYQCILSSFNEYKLSTDNENFYIRSFLENINNNSPFRLEVDERIQIYNIFELELKQQSLFRAIPYTKETTRYVEIFNQNLEDRMKQKKEKYDVIDINNFYEYQMTITYVEKKKLIEYIKGNNKKQQNSIIHDLQLILQQNENIEGKMKNTKSSDYHSQNHPNTKNQHSHGQHATQKYQIVQSKVQKLLQILDYIDFEYNIELKNILNEKIKNPSSILWGLLQSENDSVKNAFEKFIDSVKLPENKKKQNSMKNSIEFLKDIKEFNQGLRLSETQKTCLTYKEVQEFILNFEHQILYFEQTIVPQQKYQYIESSLRYIQKKKDNFNEQSFKLSFIKECQINMFQENQVKLQKENCEKNGFSKFENLNSWQMLCYSIYDLIKSEMTNSNSKVNNKKENSDSEEISQQNTSLIKIIMSKIEQEILLYNKSFANFGIILSGIGERCIYYYSMLIIWRFTCYKKGKGVQDSKQKFESLKQNQLQKFIADIKQNKTEQSKLKAEVFIRNFYKRFIEQFYRDNQNIFCTEIKNKNKMNSAQLIKLLDKTILEDYQEDYNLKKYTDQEIFQYITDQSKFIENYVQKEVNKIEVEIKDQYQNKLRSTLLTILEKLKFNIQKLRQHTDIQTPPVKSKEYFIINDNDDKKDEFYEIKLFQLIISSLQGDKNQLLKQVESQIQNEYYEIFWNDQYQKLEVNILDKIQFQESELQIQLLQPFAIELENQLNIHIEQGKQENISLGEFKSYHELQTIKLNMIGCLHTCPMCKRKCDQENSTTHQHKCSNGHQLRGMNGVLIEDTPSLFTCDEMDDECIIVTQETKVTKKWKDIRKEYQEWRFQEISASDQQNVKEKMMKVWNQGTGQMVCEQLKKVLKRKDIKFVLKNEFTEVIRQPKIHYVFMLDDSGSMYGSAWNMAKTGCISCISEIQKNLNARVSVIIFNSNARIAINCESVNLVQMEQRIVFQNGGTDFAKAFQEAYNLIIQHQNDAFEKTEILFYTDGGDSYPKQQVQLFTELPDHQKNRIFVHCCTEESSATTLQMIVQEFNCSQIKSELKEQFKVEDLKKTWAEVVSREYHNLRG